MDLQIFQSMPGNSVLLLPDASRFTIVAATGGYLQTSAKSKEELIGKGLFDVFPGLPDDPERKSAKVLRDSLGACSFKKGIAQLAAAPLRHR